MTKHYSFNSVEEATLYMVEFYEVQQVIWDHMHDSMQYNDDVINAMGIVSAYVCKERDKLLTRDPKHSITLDEVFPEE